MRLNRADLKRLGLDHLAGLIPRRPRAIPVPPAARVLYPGYPGRWILVVDGWRPTFDNELKRHPMAAHRRKKRDVAVIARALLVHPIPAAISRRRLTLTIRNRFVTMPDDPAPLKSLWDALVRNGLLVDDSREWLEFAWPPTFERGSRCTTIELEDIPC